MFARRNPEARLPDHAASERPGLKIAGQIEVDHRHLCHNGSAPRDFD
jgi:hypothetical protein